MASLVCAIFTFFPFINTSPDSFSSAPQRSLIVSVLPAPTKPAKPSISPFFNLNDTSFTLDDFKFLTSSITGASFATLLFCLGSSNISRPTIILIISFISQSATYLVSIYSPSRITLTLSAILFISPNLCEMNTIATPFALSFSIFSKSSRHSASDKEAVGSSIIRTFVDSNDIALAISTICALATLKFFNRSVGLTSIPKSLISTSHFLFIVLSEQKNPLLSLPINTF